MKKLSILAVLALTLAAPVLALEVNQPEIQSVGNEVIQFENYTGPHKTIDSIESIEAIGKGLGSSVSRSVTTQGTFNLNGKYSIIHAVDTSTAQKLDADILVLSENASVDHITNLRRIIASYLTSAYGYSAKDASTIATFVTIYNAVYRGRMDVFKDRYKDVVVQNLTADKCGLSTKWNEWPGKSQIVIPLSDLNGGLSTVDTTTITDKEVIDSMREDDDRGIDDRKEMVDLKEREAEEAEKKAEDAQKKADDAQKKADDAKKTSDDAQKKADDAQKAADEKKKDAESSPDDEKKQKEAEDAQKKADEAQQEADQAKEKADEAQKEADEAQKEADEAQEKADQKNEEAQEDREGIAQDQKEVIEKTAQSSQAEEVSTVIGLTSTSGTYSQMVKIDGNRGTLVKGSPVTVIRGKTILSAGSVSITDSTGKSVSSPAYMAVCGTNSGNGEVKLCLLDSENMEIQAESNEVLADNSVLVQNGSDYYCVIRDGESYVVAKYDAKLKLQQKSPVPVAPETPITVTAKGLVVTAPNGRPLLLKALDLTQVTE